MPRTAGFRGFCTEVACGPCCKLLVDKWLSFGCRRGSHKTGAKRGSIAWGRCEDDRRMPPIGGIVGSNTRGVYVRFGSLILIRFAGKGVVYCGN